ncbi:MAG: gliding motility protein GldM [Bacteroides sp.]|nr:gliding motility protein GldM [Ruminococcus flavefaciens]MCM1554857.1 gliding motility protein GldM [Bacteroides sp.]
MMYLVYTALLALNVSVAVLDSFLTINESMETTNSNYVQKNADLYQRFMSAYTANEAKVGKYWEKAKKVQEKTKEFYEYLQRTKIDLIAFTEQIPYEEAEQLNPRNIGRQDNYDDPTRFFLGLDNSKSGRAYELHEKLHEYRDFLLEQVEERDRPNIPLRSLHVSGTKYHNANGEEQSWEVFHFSHTIIVADLALLNKIQNDVLNSENDIISYLYSSVSDEDFKFDTISARVVPVSNSVLVGSSFEASVFVAAFDSKAKITATIDGREYEGAGGSIQYKAAANTIGKKKVNGTIHVPASFGVKSYPFQFEYDVRQSTATVSADKMNVFYVGVDNPVSAIAGGITDENTQVEITNGTISKVKPGEYVVRVSKPGVEATVNVYAKEDHGKRTLMGSKTFRVKRVPDPVARINGQEEGVKRIDKNTLANAGGLLVSMKDFEFELNLKIAAFNVQVSRDGELSPMMNSNGNKFTQGMIDNFKRCKRGDKIFFTDIYAAMPEGNRMLGDMILTIK